MCESRGTRVLPDRVPLASLLWPNESGAVYVSPSKLLCIMYARLKPALMGLEG